MSQFEFTTKEEREAWEVIRPAINKTTYVGVEAMIVGFDEAAARFDAREKTCGTEPLSGAHARLIVAEAEKLGKDSGYFHCSQNGLLRGSFTTDKGSRVLANLNAMCKVER